MADCGGDRGGRSAAPGAAAPPVTLERVAQWCDEAEHGLQGTLGRDSTAAREGVNSGRLELWRVNGDSWLVTGIDGDCLVIWAYRGRGAASMLRAMFDSARANGLRRLAFYTKRRALKRLFARSGFAFAELETLYEAEVH